MLVGSDFVEFLLFEVFLGFWGFGDFPWFCSFRFVVWNFGFRVLVFRCLLVCSDCGLGLYSGDFGGLSDLVDFVCGWCFLNLIGLVVCLWFVCTGADCAFGVFCMFVVLWMVCLCVLLYRCLFWGKVVSWWFWFWVGVYLCCCLLSCLFGDCFNLSTWVWNLSVWVIPVWRLLRVDLIVFRFL